MRRFRDEQKRDNRDTSWQKVGKWYGDIVGERGHFFHQTIIMPNSLKLLGLKDGMSLIDIACGNGVLARYIPKSIKYLGLDKARDLITIARKENKNPLHNYEESDVTIGLRTKDKFDRATIILALQNIKDPFKTISNISSALNKDGKLLIVLNHPCFRIPRQTSWEIDEKNKMQFRRVNKYMSPMEIPINMHPGKQQGPVTWSFHHPIQDYTNYLFSNGFLIEKLEEWTSEKTSVGKAAKMENLAREEFPMFLAILAVKK